MSRPVEITAFAYNKRGKLLSVGVNSYIKTHPMQARYAKRTGRSKAVFLHAEVAALLKAKEQVYRMVVVRYDKAGKPAIAKPCPACALALHEFGVRMIEHT